MVKALLAVAADTRCNREPGYTSWQAASAHLRTLGYDKSAKSCYEKYQGLLRTFKNQKQQRSQSGSGWRGWQWFQQIEELESENHAITSPYLSGSMTVGTNANNGVGINNGVVTMVNITSSVAAEPKQPVGGERTTETTVQSSNTAATNTNAQPTVIENSNLSVSPPLLKGTSSQSPPAKKRTAIATEILEEVKKFKSSDDSFQSLLTQLVASTTALLTQLAGTNNSVLATAAPLSTGAVVNSTPVVTNTAPVSNAASIPSCDHVDSNTGNK